MPSLSTSWTIADDSPDPCMLFVPSKDKYYQYSTNVGFQRIPVRSSTNLSTWTSTTDAFGTKPSWATDGYYWAPHVLATNRTYVMSATTGAAGSTSVTAAATSTPQWAYVMYYSARHTASGFQVIGRAVSNSPTGPFQDDTSAPFISQVELGGCIDPFVWTSDTTGNRYMLWKSDENALGNDARLWIAPLSADGLTVNLASAQAVLTYDRAWEDPLIEQPCLVRHDGMYYLFYSANWWESGDYAIGYATATTIFGPYTKQTTTGPWYSTVSGPGAMSVFTTRLGALYACWHQWYGSNSYGTGGQRRLNIGPLTF